MLIFSLILLSALGLMLVARAGTQWRNQMIWGAVFGVPLVVVQLLIVGGWRQLGIDWTDSALTLMGLLAVGATVSALLAVAYGRYIDPRLAPTGHLSRHQTWLLGLGLGLTLILGFFGMPWLLAAMVGVTANVAMMVLTRRLRLLWDILTAGAGLAIWYGLFELLLGIRSSGNLEALIGNRDPIGLTMFGRPLEVVLFSLGIGFLLGPLFAATKHWRNPNATPVTTISGRKVSLGVAVVTLALVVFGVSADLSLWPPRAVAVTPIENATAIATDTELVVQFDRPIDRNSLELSISPDASGSWIFERPSTGHHGFRQARFRFSPTLLPATTYRGTIAGIRSVWAAAGRSLDFSFTTRDLPSVTGLATPSPADPCQPLTITLSGPYDQAADFQASFEPAVASTISGLTPTSLSVLPASCLEADHDYRLTIRRRTVTRDPDAREIVAADQPDVMLETTFRTGSPSPSAKVLGAVTAASGGLTPVRPEKVLNVGLDYQDQPLSCEAAALKMALAAQGIHVSERDIMRQVGYDPTPHKGQVWGDPDKAFVGNIAGRQNTTGYGVHWAPIARAARAWRSARAFRFATPERVAQEIQAGHAVVIWGTIGPAYRYNWWTPDGKLVRAWKGEHARTIIGFYGLASTPTHFVLNDPVVGRLTWSRSQLVYNSGAFGMSGVIVE